MIADRYTKAVLTVIAVCLVWLSLGGPALLVDAQAQGNQPARGSREVNQVVIAGWVDRSNVVHQLPTPNNAATSRIRGVALPVDER